MLCDVESVGVEERGGLLEGLDLAADRAEEQCGGRQVTARGEEELVAVLLGVGADDVDGREFGQPGEGFVAPSVRRRCQYA